MGIYKRGGVYWYKFMWQGSLVRESAKTGNDKTARKLESAHRTRLAEGLVGIREKKIVPSLAEFCKQRITPYAEPRTSWIWYRAGMRALQKYAPLASMPLDEIKGEHAASFASWRLSQEVVPGYGEQFAPSPAPNSEARRRLGSYRECAEDSTTRGRSAARTSHHT